MRKTAPLVASMALAVVLACVAAALAAVPGAAQTSTVTLVGAGDIASCSQTNDSATARLLGRIQGTFFTFGVQRAGPRRVERVQGLLRLHLGEVQEPDQAHRRQPRLSHCGGETLLQLLPMACGEAQRLLLLRARKLAYGGPEQQLRQGRGGRMRQALASGTLAQERPEQPRVAVLPRLFPPPALRYGQEHHLHQGETPLGDPLQPRRGRHPLGTRPPLRALRPDKPRGRGRPTERHPPVRGGDRGPHGGRWDRPQVMTPPETRQARETGKKATEPWRGVPALEVRVSSRQILEGVR